jgi:hypothetical protein
MADNPVQPGAEDRTRIAVEQEHEMRYWTEMLDVTAERLLEAVKAVGPRAADVERYLKRTA